MTDHDDDVQVHCIGNEKQLVRVCWSRTRDDDHGDTNALRVLGRAGGRGCTLGVPNVQVTGRHIADGDVHEAIQRIGGQDAWILVVSPTPAEWEAVLNDWKQEWTRHNVLVIAMVRDKDVQNDLHKLTRILKPEAYGMVRTSVTVCVRTTELAAKYPHSRPQHVAVLGKNAQMAINTVALNMRVTQGAKLWGTPRDAHGGPLPWTWTAPDGIPPPGDGTVWRSNHAQILLQSTRDNGTWEIQPNNHQDKCTLVYVANTTLANDRVRWLANLVACERTCNEFTMDQTAWSTALAYAGNVHMPPRMDRSITQRAGQ
mgnify:CR=1 FL=1